MCVEKAGSILNIFNPFFHKKKWKDATKYASNDSFDVANDSFRDALGDESLDVVDVIAKVVIAAGVVAVNLVELDVVVHVTADKVNRLVDLDRLGELSVRLEVTRLVS